MSCLKKKLEDKNSCISFFGCIPPPAIYNESRRQECVQSINHTMSLLLPDALMIYDIIDEPSRSGEPRPFPFTTTYDPLEYAKEISHILKSNHQDCFNLNLIIYRTVSGMTESNLNKWLKKRD